MLALDAGGGDSLDGGVTPEGELLTRAREAKAKLEITACAARGESSPGDQLQGVATCLLVAPPECAGTEPCGCVHFRQTTYCRLSLRPLTRSLKVSYRLHRSFPIRVGGVLPASLC